MTGEREDSVVRDQAGKPGIHLVQNGWQVQGRTGETIGEVVGRDEDSMVVRLEGGDDDQVRIPTQLIAEEDEAAMLATLSVGSSELDTVVPLVSDDDATTPLT